MSYDSVAPLLSRSRDDQLARVMRRGARIRWRRRTSAIVPASLAAVAVCVLLWQADRALTNVHVDTVPVAPAPGGGAGEVSPATTEPATGGAPPTTPPAPGSPGQGQAAGDRRSSPSGEPPGPGGSAAPEATAPAADGPEPAGTAGCNVVGTDSPFVEIGADEEYARGDTCDYEPVEPGGYVASGADWEIRVRRGGTEWVLSARAGSSQCERKGYFQPGDRVRITVGRGSHVAAGPRYGCP